MEITHPVFAFICTIVLSFVVCSLLGVFARKTIHVLAPLAVLLVVFILGDIVGVYETTVDWFGIASQLQVISGVNYIAQTILERVQLLTYTPQSILSPVIQGIVVLVVIGVGAAGFLKALNPS